jgi:hypothetical protein
MTIKPKPKPKRKNAPGQGRKPEGRTLCTIGMLPRAWTALDRVRGAASRGKAVEKLLGI